MTEILLIRHGETLWNQQGRMQGQNDSPLTALGLHQARQLGSRLKDVSFTTLYSSDLGRAHQTARCIADATGHEVLADTGLRERCFGIFEGLTNAEIKVQHPEEHVRFATRDPDYAMPGGESTVQFRDRCVACLESIAQRHERRNRRRRLARPRARHGLSHGMPHAARRAARVSAAQLRGQHLPARPGGMDGGCGGRCEPFSG